MKDLNEYLDFRGLPVHRPNYPNLTIADGGDSLNRLGHIYFCKYLSAQPSELAQIRAEFAGKLAFYKVNNGNNVVYSRYPWFIDSQWSYLHDDLLTIIKDSLKDKEGQVKWACGRDQLKPIRLACKQLGLIFELNELEQSQSNRHGRYQNFDVSWFEGNPYLYIQTRLCMQRLEKDSSDVGDFLNLTMELIHKRASGDKSFWVEKAIKYVNDKDKTIWQRALTKYFNPSYPNPLSAPPIDSLYQPLIEKYLL